MSQRRPEDTIPLIPHDEEDKPKAKRCCGRTVEQSTKSEIFIIVLMIIVIICGSGNRIAYKIMTVPMQNYSFFLSFFNSIMYVLLYFGILFARVLCGIAPKDHLKYGWRRQKLTIEEDAHYGAFRRFFARLPPVKYFIVMGICDSLGIILGLIAAPYMNPQLISLMSQTIILFSMGCSLLILKARYNYWQVWAACLVTTGALVSLMGGGVGSGSLFWSIITALSTIPSALSFALKELVFRNKKDLDLFVVNSHGSLFSLVFWPALLPLNILFDQTHGEPLGVFISEGFRCFVGETVKGKSCAPMPWPYVIYIAFNLAYNISLLLLLKKASALQGFMASTAILPVVVLLFFINWPLIGSEPVNVYVMVGLVVVLSGLVLYRYTTFVTGQSSNHSGCCNCTPPFCDRERKGDTKVN